MIKKSLFSLTSSALILYSPFSLACGTFARVGGYVPFINEEVATIIWDKKNSTEHFIRTANFTGNGSDFAFIVPVPSTPVLAEAPTELYGWLYSVAYSVGGIGGRGFGKGEASGGGGSSGVTVIKRQEVAGLDAVVLSATSANNLQNWLNINGYQTSREATSWIKHYVDKQWQFVAFKIKASTDQAKQKDWQTSSPTVRISFKTTRPFYPYKEPASQKGSPKRELSLIILAPTKVTGSYETKGKWPFDFDFKKPFELDAIRGSLLAQYLSLEKPGKLAMNGEENEVKAMEHKIDMSGNPKLFLSHFRSSEIQRTAGEDVYFNED